MDGYFIIVSERESLKRVDTIDVAEHQSAKDIASDKIDEGYYVSIWHGTRIYTGGRS